MKRKTHNWTLPPAIEARLGEHTYGRQRAVFEEGHLLLILREPARPGSNDRDTVLVWRHSDGRYQANGTDGGDARLRRLLAEYRSRWDELDKLYDQARSADDLFQLLEALAPLKRSSDGLANALQEARTLVEGDRFLIGMRDEAYEIARAFDLLTGDARLKLDHRIAKDSEHQSVRSGEIAAAQHKLNKLAALTLPLTALAALLGMNVTHGLEGRSPLVFLGVLMAGGLVGFGVRAWVAR
jgi:Mg2+ and Co2+ transporter CorA